MGVPSEARRFVRELPGTPPGKVDSGVAGWAAHCLAEAELRQPHIAPAPSA